eukprot:c28554_g1_i1 orf=366-3035(+)
MECFKGSPRLPTFALPISYDIKLRPNLKTYVFDGKIIVVLDIVKETSCLVLNAIDLDISQNSVSLRSRESPQVLLPVSLELDKEDGILMLSFEQSLPLGEVILSMEFKGVLNDHLKGLYKSSYTLNGEKRCMAATQFEPSDARRCFPCWDEPSFKAIFKLTVEAPVDRFVLSNMPVEVERIDGNSKIVSFQESPKMSSYLVALVVGEFGYIENETVAGHKVRVYCEIGKTEQGRFALDLATSVLTFYSHYFGTPYPLPKLDMVAIPDFSGGAMENYGLVTYREADLLYDENNSSAVNKQRVAIVVAHELAHQWFGNLVTMEWWTHLWLNEGFATWVSYLAVDYLFPDWNIWTQFIDETRDAFRLDGLVESHPIEVEVHHHQQIDEIFDAISYKKGASIIRMLQSYLGPDTFQKGLISYIKKYAYKNASTDELWAVLSEVSGEPVRELMDSWTKQKGYPVVSVKRRNNTLEVEQSQYLSSGLPGSGEWIIPIVLCCGSYKSTTTSLIQGKVAKVSLPNSDLMDASGNSEFSQVNAQEESKIVPSTWVKLNVGQTGFYRVQYDEGLASCLRSAIAIGSLNPVDKFGILDDTYALCMACKQPLSTLLFLMDVYRNETDYTVLTCLIDIAYRVSMVVSDAIPAAASEIRCFSSKLLQNAAKKLSWDVTAGEGHLDTMLRGELLTALVSFGHNETIVEGMQRFDAFMKDRNTLMLLADIRNAAYKAVMQNTTALNRTGYESLLKIYKETDLSQERVRILSKLASSSDPALVCEALDFCLCSEVRNQDAIFVLSGISAEGREAAWLWLKRNWDLIWSCWGGNHLIIRFISTITSKLSSDEKAEEVETFFGEHCNPYIERTVKQSIERVRITAQWAKHIREEVGVLEFIQELASHN